LSATVAGLSETETGLAAKLTVDVDFLVGSAELVAVTVTVCALGTEAGAEYIPPGEIVPTAGERDQVTAVFEEPATVAVNCCD
jgi:hypothetical protein